MSITGLPKWNKLTPAEKKQLKKVFAPRIKAKYDLEGKLSLGKKEGKNE